MENRIAIILQLISLAELEIAWCSTWCNFLNVCPLVPATSAGYSHMQAHRVLSYDLAIQLQFQPM